MRDLAPDIIRKRFLIEGYFQTEVDEEKIKEHFSHICQELKLRMYGEPIVFSPEGMGKGDNQGYDAFVPLIDSGISLYIWSEKKFLSALLYTCKEFDEARARTVTKQFFNIEETEEKLF